ncbi:lipoprotein insertase outer membrane protein LolB [Dechloromonas sp. XY25]|uniref:Outer-membrane lipoprotein LolB n=1 Tax=Dechloromonas hankyongensis TaxID=2908002 RepID=A0ABS9JWV7_9RHOO|nr:lipoprotein insertase outer membrane protein LolB [Dechloromonas hankyongensis]MCG2575396.1 lipoprotein insertase outer membrane protein LolB [Dechloromonas hankyongensis]
MSRLFLALAFGLLAACASVPRAALAPRDDVRNFSLDARFALRATLPGQSAQSSGGRLTWTHQHDSDRILVANPLGYGVAEIDASPTISRLRTADGKERESGDPDALIEDVTGLRLPVARLPGWLLGRAGSNARIAADALGRPGQLREAGWQVDYFYDDERPTALPARLTISRPGELELKLRIEEWRETP